MFFGVIAIIEPLAIKKVDTTVYQFCRHITFYLKLV